MTAETDETLVLLDDSVRAFVERSGGTTRVRALRDQPPGFDRDRWTEMAENGWLGVHLPEEAGGLGLGHGALVRVMGGLGRGLAPEPVVPAAVLGGGILAALSGDRARELTAGVVDGSLIPAPAIQAHAGEYAAEPAPATFANGRLDGEAHFVLAPEGADGFLVAADEGGAPRLVWVPRGSGGVSIRSEARADGGTVGSVAFAEVGSAEIVADGPGIPEAVAAAVDSATLATAAELAGVMAGALDATTAYVGERKQFGRAIGSFQALQHRLVDMWTQMELARASVANAVQAVDRPGVTASERARAVSAAKARAADAAGFVTRQCVQLWGGMGYTDEADPGLYLKRALVLSAWLGTAAWHRRRFARLDGAGRAA